MNGSKIMITGCVLGWVLLAGCAKDINQFTPETATDTAWVQQVPAGSAVIQLSDSLRLSPAVEALQLPASGILSLDSLQCLFTGITWKDPTGASYSGPAQVQGLLVTKPGEWIRQSLVTSCGGKLIQTGAALFLSVTSGGDTLQPDRPVTLTLPLTAAVDADQVWRGGYTGTALQWATPLSTATVSDTTGGLTLTTAATGWLLVGTTAGGDTSASVTAILPNSFSNANSAVFCLLPGQRILVALEGDPATRTFKVSGLPGGASALLVSLTFTGNGTYYLGTASFTLAGGMSTEFMTPSIQTLSSVVSYLEQL